MRTEEQQSMTPLLNLLKLAGLVFLALALPLWLVLALGDAPPLIPGGFFLWSHSLLEMLSIVIAGCIFFIGWQMVDSERRKASLLLACAFLSVAMFDAAHLLSYPGMPDFLTPNSPHRAILFWLTARFIAAASILVYLLTRMDSVRVADTPARYLFLFATLGLTALLWIPLTFYPDFFPIMFVPETGLTSSKLIAEACILLIHVATLLLIWWRRNQLRLKSSGALVMAVALMAAGESFFLLYQNVQDLSNFVGHVYKTLAYAYLYRAVFLDSIREPIEQLRQTHLTLQQYTSQLDELLENAPDGIVGINRDGLIAFANPAVEKLFGYTADELRGEHIEILLPIALRERHQALRNAFTESPQGRPMSSLKGLVGRRKDGREVPLDIALGVHTSNDGMHITAFIRDVSERFKLERDMRHRATHDLLTGLPNRALMQDRLDWAIAHARRSRSAFALIMIDLDNFKDINDGWGHSLGDQLLVTVARRLNRSLREGDTVARFGGDEFVVLAQDMQNAEAATAIVEKITEAMRNVFVLANQQFLVSASIGVACYPEHADDAESLLSSADIAMYQAKARGRHTACYFNQDMGLHQQESLQIKMRLTDALANRQLAVYYQPQYRVSDRQVIGLEALLRWEIEPGNWISPDVFIPIAEANGLIIPVTELVIASVCRQVRQWADAGVAVRTYINISALHFRQRGVLLAFIEKTLAEYALDPALLGIELTETALMDSSDFVIETLRSLAAIGLHIAIDDFGTGYSSLASLQLYPVHTLKIDRSFMRELQPDSKTEAIITGLINLADSLDLEVMAEGVETIEQYNILLGTNCDSMQGWLMHPALPVDDCTMILQQSAQPEADDTLAAAFQSS
tara:strand:- start:9276 stop:11855 length:2580 start_codon:yes stop_codon:yes gene_type:complete